MTYIQEDSEILDLVDHQDVVIGKIDRRETYKLADGIGYVRAADAYIMNDEGQLWVPIRTLTKKISPGGFDFSAAEHVGSDETYTEAMVRGFQEELNISLTPEDLIFTGVIAPDKEKGIYYFRAIYLYHSNQTPQYNPNDYTGAQWMTPAELREKIESGAPAKTVILPALDYLVAKKFL